MNSVCHYAVVFFELLCALAGGIVEGKKSRQIMQ